ncbi:MAG: T9SS type A sorting domain-containing protein, partial [Bacteroidota bacterium]
VNIYPNPANDKIEISFYKKSQIEILNIEGQLLKSMKANDTHAIIDISAFAKGMYFVKVKNENGFAVEKFIKE